MFRKHPVRTVLLLILSALVLTFVITGAVILSAASGTSGAFQYLLVLGNTVEGTEPSSILRDRINAAYDYLIAHPDVICIVSGYRSGKGEISEAACMFRELTEMGIPEDRIWMEPNASSTLENLDFSLSLIQEKTGTRPDTIGILSSEFHLFRAAHYADEYGIHAVTVPARTSDFGGFLFWFAREILVVLATCIF